MTVWIWQISKDNQGKYRLLSVYLHLHISQNAANISIKLMKILYNAIWELPTERVEEAVVACLPYPSYVLPREKQAPKPKPLTKWEQYAKEKGNFSSTLDLYRTSFFDQMLFRKAALAV